MRQRVAPPCFLIAELAVRTIAVMLAVVVVGACSAAPTAAQFIDDQVKSQSRLENPHKVRVQIGMTFHAAGSPMLGIYGTTPVPRDWDEQKVRIVGEDRSPEVRVSYRTLGDTTRQMVITVPRVPPQSEAHALITFEVTRYAIAPPTKTDEYHIPEHVEGMLRQYLGPSPAIESRHAKIRELAKKIFAEKENATDWQKIEALDDYVLAHLKYRAGSLKGALAGLNDGNGDCEEFSSLFIAVLPRQRRPGPHGLDSGPLLQRVLSSGQERQGNLVPLPVGRRQVVRRHRRLSPDLAEGGQFPRPRFFQAAALRGGVPQDQGPRRTTAAIQVRPQSAGGLMLRCLVPRLCLGTQRLPGSA